MKMKLTAALFITLMLCSMTALAKVPYGELEALRKQTVITRVAMDQPNHGAIAKCVSPDKLVGAGQALSLASDSAAAGWANVKILAEDLSGLKSKISHCERRGSCQVYELFLNAAMSEGGVTADVDKMKTGLTNQLSNLTGKSYQEALRGIANPCGILKNLIAEIQ